MIIDGPCFKKEGYFDDASTTTASLPISQLISFNCVKRRSMRNEDQSKLVIRHNSEREMPFLLYGNLEIHTENRNKGLIDTMCELGLSISYDRIISISTDAANSVCSRLEQDGVVCPPKLHENLFTIGALDNILSAVTKIWKMKSSCLGLYSMPHSNPHQCSRLV